MGSVTLFCTCVWLQYNKDLAKVFESVKVDLQNITLLEQAGRDNLINFANSGIGQIDYEAYLSEVRVISPPSRRRKHVL